MDSRITDEVVLVSDMFVNTDPVSGLRDRAKRLTESHGWTSDGVDYGDQAEPSIDENGDTFDDEIPKRWSFAFEMGLDNIENPRPGWFDEVVALLQFLKRETELEPDSEASVVVSFRSRSWYSMQITIVDADWSFEERLRGMIQWAIRQ